MATSATKTLTVIITNTGATATSILGSTPPNPPYTADGLLEAAGRALELYRNRPPQWLQLMQTGMRQDWSWDRSAAEYERLYQRLKSSVISYQSSVISQ